MSDLIIDHVWIQLAPFAAGAIAWLVLAALYRISK